MRWLIAWVCYRVVLAMPARYVLSTPLWIMERAGYYAYTPRTGGGSGNG